MLHDLITSFRVAFAAITPSELLTKIWESRGGVGCLNSFSASISGASAAVRLPSGVAAG